MKFLSLGTIVKVKDAEKRLMIVGRGMRLNQNKEEKIFDYGAVPYPEGIIGDQLCFINHEDIVDIIYQGFSDEENVNYVNMVENIYNELGR